jgi:hypothetical protein
VRLPVDLLFLPLRFLFLASRAQNARRFCRASASRPLAVKQCSVADIVENVVHDRAQWLTSAK